MDLRNGEIKMGEVLLNPDAKELLQKEFPRFMNRTMMNLGRNMTLNQIIALAARTGISRTKIDQVMAGLKEI